MREEYIRLIKEYISQKPNYKEAITELRANVLSIGATEQELDEAFKQMAIPEDLAQELKNRQALPKALPLLKIKLLLKKLQTIPFFTRYKTIALALIALALTSGIVSFSILLFANKPESKNVALENQGTLVQASVKKPIQLAPIVYASTQEIDSNKVFSYPATKVTLQITGSPKRDVFGFFPYWMLDNQDKVSFAGLTHIGLFGLEVDGKGNILTKNDKGDVDGGWAMWNNGKISQVIAKAKRQRIKVELVIKCFNNDNIEHLVLSDDAQKVFISNVLFMVKAKSLDGVNLDFEYIGTPSPGVSAGFTRIVTNLNAELKRQIPNALLSVDTYLTSAAIPRLFEIEPLADQIDSFIIMGYDVHTPNGDPGPIAPMEGDQGILGYVQSYLEKVDSSKIILAVPYYAYDWIVDPNLRGNEKGTTIPYAEVADESKNYKIQWDPASQTPYYNYIDQATRKTHVVFYEDTRSLGIKYDFVNKKNLRGIGIWALGYDGLNNDLRSLIIEKFAN